METEDLKKTEDALVDYTISLSEDTLADLVTNEDGDFL